MEFGPPRGVFHAGWFYGVSHRPRVDGTAARMDMPNFTHETHREPRIARLATKVVWEDQRVELLGRSLGLLRRRRADHRKEFR